MVRLVPVGVLALLAGCNTESSVTKQDPTLEITPAVLDLGDVIVGSTNAGEYTLADVGRAKATISTITVTNDNEEYFSFNGEIPDVPRLESNVFSVDYAPLSDGYHSATVTVTYDNPDEPQLTAVIRAHAVVGSARVYPALLDFGNVAIGDSRTLELTIANDGGLSLSLEGAAFSSPDFELLESLPYELPAGADVPVEIMYTATVDSAVSEQVQLDLGGIVQLPAVTLRANDCEHGNPSTYDEDADGYTTCGGDCNDQDPLTNPAGVETADGYDEDCDGTIDEGTEAYDDDGDGLSEREGDCNDGDATVSPSANEDYDNGIDDDCDGVVDNGTLDADYDGYSESGGDCLDSDASVYPDAPEVADGQDNDCDGIIDEGTTAYDDDSDGRSEDAGDCDDTDRTIYPGAVELADWKDNDCDGTVDEGTENYDDDGDGFTETGGDCDDSAATTNPAAAEIARNSIDDNCDGTTS